MLSSNNTCGLCNIFSLDEKEDDSTSTEPPAEDEKTPDKADTDKENPDPDIFTSGDDFGDGSKSNPFHVVIDSDNPEDGDAPQITDPVIDNGGYSGGGGGGNSTSDSSSEKILHFDCSFYFEMSATFLL